MKNILFITEGADWGGIESYVNNVIPNINKDNFNVGLLTLHKNKLFTEVSNKNINTYCIQKAKKIEIRFFYKILRAPFIKKYNIIHANGFIATIVAVFIKLFNHRVKIIVTYHGLIESEFFTQYRHLDYRTKIEILLFKYFVDKIVAVSKQIGQFFLDFKIPSEKIEIIYNGIDNNIVFKGTTEKINSEYQLGDSLIIGTIGRLDFIKGHIYVFEALQKILEVYPMFKYMIVGDGPLKSFLENEAERLDLRENVLFLGSRDDIYDILKLIDILIIPSLNEGLPYVLLEAGLMKKFIIASDVGGLSEIISNGYDGILVKPKDVTGIYKAIIDYIRNKDKFQKYGERLSNKIKANFIIKKNVINLESIYNSI